MKRGATRKRDFDYAARNRGKRRIGETAPPTIHRVRIGKVTLKRQVSSRKSMPFNDTLNMLRRDLARRAAAMQGGGK